MTDPIEAHRLYGMTHPKSVAIFGASNNHSSMGTIILRAMMAFDFPGKIYPVHLKEKEVQGLTAFDSVESLPEAPDLAVIVLPTRIVCETMEACGKKGIRNAIVVSGGFKEVGPEGAEREKELAAIAGKYGISIIGPNCLGVTNAHARLNTTPHRYYGKPGFIGLVSQSGSFVTQMFAYLDQLHLGFSTAFSIGNEVNTDLVDCLEFLGACPDTKVIALYVEAIRRGRKFVETARKIVPHKPIVALYVGGSETGRKAALSHTGSMSGPDDLYSGIFRQSGVIRVSSITELFDCCMAFGHLPQPAANRVFIQTHSGGPGAVAADACGRSGLVLPEPSAKTAEKLKALVPATGSVKNPIDLTFTKDMTQFFADIPGVLLEDPGCDALMFYYYTPADMIKRVLLQMGVPAAELDAKMDEVSQHISAQMQGLIKRSGKPVFCFSYQGRSETAVQSLSALGVPFYQGPERAVRALAAMVAYGTLKEKIVRQSGIDPSA
ncbi:acetate--CoA ligase family protein [Desulfosudis oleivorans]|uniref:CoA-binding domain protein n=1 Tax=Desulfosudis oleivorans (strain DSM 6200 / JCM 39069 / Hxd3) TaxID=96561 RepID=A8ZSN5_DESOH|nr:CoA-binding protein [Desulfosudis oleivorans]ABW65948.1 CoA-binding domain protein [Desulfosudis oleivorans Hxd3]